MDKQELIKLQMDSLNEGIKLGKKMAAEYIATEVSKLVDKGNIIKELSNNWARIITEAKQ